MKKIVIVLSILLLGSGIMAQGFSIGPQIGFSSTTILEKNDLTGRIDKNLKLGYQLGVAAEFELMSFLYVGSAVTFFQKGDSRGDDTFTSKTKLGYIDIPITIGYKMPLGNVSVFGNVGPYSSIAIIGKTYYQTDMGQEELEENYEIEFGEEMGQYKRFDTGVTFGGGVEFKQFQVKANYSFGLVDITYSEFVTSKHSVFNITGTYFIGRNF